MASRYSYSRRIVNDHESYKELFKNRGVEQIVQVTNPKFRIPTPEEIKNLQLIGHTWSVGDRFYKLAYQYYGDATYWWVIAQFNRRPTEHHVSIGDLIYVPLPLDKVISYFQR